jgi:hypothetical protein
LGTVQVQAVRAEHVLPFDAPGQHPMARGTEYLVVELTLAPANSTNPLVAYLSDLALIDTKGGRFPATGFRFGPNWTFGNVEIVNALSRPVAGACAFAMPASRRTSKLMLAVLDKPPLELDLEEVWR